MDFQQQSLLFSEDFEDTPRENSENDAKGEGLSWGRKTAADNRGKKTSGDSGMLASMTALRKPRHEQV